MTVDLDALLDKAVSRKNAEPNTKTVEVLVGDEVWSLKFTELDSKRWTDITATHPFRPGSLIDQNYGYDYHASCEAAAVISGVRVDGDDEIEFTPLQWEKLFTALDSPGRGAVTDAIWGLNEYDPAQRLAAAKKALKAAQRQKRP